MSQHLDVNAWTLNLNKLQKNNSAYPVETILLFTTSAIFRCTDYDKTLSIGNHSARGSPSPPFQWKINTGISNNPFSVFYSTTNYEKKFDRCWSRSGKHYLFRNFLSLRFELKLFQKIRELRISRSIHGFPPKLKFFGPKIKKRAFG